jgi:hypothetical protein
MCIGCEMGFWMAMDESPAAAVAPGARAAHSAKRSEDGFACDAPEAKPAERSAARRKPRARAPQRMLRERKP